MKQKQCSQTVFEMARDMIKIFEDMGSNETIMLGVTKNHTFYDFTCSNHIPCGYPEVAEALRKAYRSSMGEGNEK